MDIYIFHLSFKYAMVKTESDSNVDKYIYYTTQYVDNEIKNSRHQHYFVVK